MMTLKEQLLSIKTVFLKLNAMEEQLAELRDRAMGDGSPAIDKLNVMTSLPADPMAEAIIAYADLLDEYHSTKRSYVQLRSQARSNLKRMLPDDDKRQLIYERYFEFESYGQIGRRHNLNYQQTKRMISQIVHSLSNCG